MLLEKKIFKKALNKLYAPYRSHKLFPFLIHRLNISENSKKALIENNIYGVGCIATFTESEIFAIIGYEQNDLQIIKEELIANKLGFFNHKEIEKLLIENLDLSTRTIKCLKSHGILTIFDLKLWSLEKLKKLDQLGSKSIQDIIYNLNKYKIEIAPEVVDVIEVKKEMQSCILNLSFANSVDELIYMLEKFDTNIPLMDIEALLFSKEETELYWTMPKNMEVNDIIFFYHAITANDKINRVKREVKILSDVSKEVCDALNRAEKYYEKYGGKIFAIARVSEKPELLDKDIDYHFSYSVFGKVTNIEKLETPISIREFSEFIQISRTGSITKLNKENYNKLLSIILSKNKLTENTLNFLYQATPMQPSP